MGRHSFWWLASVILETHVLFALRFVLFCFVSFCLFVCKFLFQFILQVDAITQLMCRFVSTYIMPRIYQYPFGRLVFLNPTPYKGTAGILYLSLFKSKIPIPASSPQNKFPNCCHQISWRSHCIWFTGVFFAKKYLTIFTRSRPAARSGPFMRVISVCHRAGSLDYMLVWVMLLVACFIKMLFVHVHTILN